jgi:hypothetical protein
MTREEALAILRNGQFGSLVGVSESLELEFKGEPYRLASNFNDSLDVAVSDEEPRPTLSS